MRVMKNDAEKTPSSSRLAFEGPECVTDSILTIVRFAWKSYDSLTEMPTLKRAIVK